MSADTAAHSRPETAPTPAVPSSAPVGTPQEQAEGTQRLSTAAAHDRPVVMAISNPDIRQAAKPVTQLRQEQPAGAASAHRPMVSQHERPATVQQNNAARSDASQNRPTRATTERPAATAEIRRPDTAQRPVVSAETSRLEAGKRSVMQQAESIKPVAWVQDKPAKPRPAVEQTASAKPESKPAQRKNTVQSKPGASQPGGAGAQNGGGKK